MSNRAAPAPALNEVEPLWSVIAEALTDGILIWDRDANYLYANQAALDYAGVTERKRLAEAKLHSERLAVIGAMSARLAHEIRNPLGTVLINLGLLREEIRPSATPAEALVLLESIATELRRVQHVSDGYLRFARLPQPCRTAVGLNEFLARELELVQPLSAAAGVTLRAEFAPALPLLCADEEQLWQAILNILLNAIEAMSGDGVLTVRTRHVRAQVVLTITDTGPGLPTEKHACIFDPFFTTKPGGTGLGLALARQIISEHHGQIDCQSTPGQGAMFSIRLPAHPGGNEDGNTSQRNDH